MPLRKFARAIGGLGCVATAVGALILGSAGLGHAQVPPFPKSPQTINVIDVGGVLALTQDALEKYRAAHPERVARFTYSKGPSPTLAGKIKAQQAGGRVDIDLVLSGINGISDGIVQGLWVKVLPEYESKFGGKVDDMLLPGALKTHRDAQGYAVAVVFTPAGPLLEYNPDKVKNPPKTTDELMAWCKANPDRLFYGRPAQSGPARAFLLGLPYMLGDSNPRDPVKGWDKTWAYLKELNTCIDYYPPLTSTTMKELGDGSKDMILTTMGWDINPRVLGVAPKSAKVQLITGPNGFTFVTDAQFMAIPKGISQDKLAVVLDIMAYLMKPEQQAMTYDQGYFYPGPSVKNVPLSQAPRESQDAIKEYGRPEYDKWINEYPMEPPIFAETLGIAHRMWDELIGAAAKRK